MSIKDSFEKHDIISNHKDFKMLFDEHYIPLCRYSLKFVRQPEVSEEIVQDVFVYIWNKRNEINIHTSAKAYLYKSVKNKSLDYLKSKLARYDFDTDVSTIDAHSSNDPLKMLEEKETITLIEKAIKELPEKCYTVFSMSRFGDYSNKEIAEELGISEKTVENQITIAIKKIKLYIESSSAIIALSLVFFFLTDIIQKIFTPYLGVGI